MTIEGTDLGTAIIGAGPAGVSMAVCLARRGLPYVLLEAGDHPFSALRRVDPECLLVSPTPLGRLPGMEFLQETPTYLRFQEFVELLERYAHQHDITVTTGARVERVERTDDGFRVHVESKGARLKILQAGTVVNATGVLSTPALPEEFKPEACSFSWLHSLNVRRGHLADVRNLLVVGGGISAFDALQLRLAGQRPEDRTWLSLRSPLRVVPKTLLGIDVHYWVWLPEHLPTRLLARLPAVREALRNEPMLGPEIKRAIAEERIVTVPTIAKYEGREVEFVSGERLQPDLVIFASGFSYRTDHLDGLVELAPDGLPRVRACESVCAPGLYMLGLRFARTFASPFLRGIARDAEYVARRIARAQHAAARCHSMSLA